MIITSVQNEIIKQYINLLKNKDYACLDSPKLINEAINANVKIEAMFKLQGNLDYYNSDNCFEVTENVLNKFTNTKTTQGVVAIIKIEKKEMSKPKSNFLILDNVQDPGNVGTLIRSAVGANFLDIYLINCASVTNSKTIRSTMGAYFKANIFEVDDTFYKILKDWNKTIYVADMNGTNIYNEKFDTNCGVIIGNEGKGVCDELKQIATKTIKIPMHNKLESLNAGTSGSIIMFQIANGGKNVRS